MGPCNGLPWYGHCVPLGSTGDSLVLVDSTYAATTFGLEITDQETLDDLVVMCSNQRGLVVHHVGDEGQLTPLFQRLRLGEGAHPEWPHCRRLTLARTTRESGSEPIDAFLSTTADELQPTGWVKWVRWEEGTTSLSLQVEESEAPVVSTVFAAEGLSFGGLAHRSGHVYAAARGAGLAVLRTQDSTLELLSVQPSEGGVSDVFVSASGHLLTATATGISVHDLTSPERPEHLGSATSGGLITRLVAQDELVYVAAGSAGIEVFDVTDPRAPARVVQIPCAGSVVDIAADGRWLAAADWMDVRVYALDNPRHPRLVATEELPAERGSSVAITVAVSPNGDRVLAGDWSGHHSYRIDAEQSPPDLRAHQRTLRFGPGELTAAIVVENEGWTQLDLSAYGEELGLKLAPSALIVQPFEKAVIEVSRSELAPRMDSVILQSNDPDEPLFTIPSFAEGRGMLGEGDMLPTTWSFRDIQTNQPIDLAQVTQGHVTLLSYFATF